jgi:hypothetical protein
MMNMHNFTLVAFVERLGHANDAIEQTTVTAPSKFLIIEQHSAAPTSISDLPNFRNMHSWCVASTCCPDKLLAA